MKLCGIRREQLYLVGKIREKTVEWTVSKKRNALVVGCLGVSRLPAREWCTNLPRFAFSLLAVQLADTEHFLDSL